MTKVPAPGTSPSDSSIAPFRATPITWALFTSVVVLTTAADLITKEIAFKNLGMPGTSPGWTVINKMLWWRTSLNEGALFGLGQGMGWFFVTVSFAALIGILLTVSWLRLWRDSILVLSLACITGGILGNLYDRLGIPALQWHAPLSREGDPVYAVRDWIHFRLDGIIDWPIFNLADSFLVFGAGLLLFLSFFPPAIAIENIPTRSAAEETPNA